MTFTDGSIFRYTYDAMGRKQKSSYHVGGDQMVGPVSPGTEPFPGILSLGGAELMDVPGQQSVTIVYDSIEYCGNVLYDNGHLDKVFVDGGYATLNATTGQPTFHFYVRDHLGSIRRIVRQDGVVERTNHYYPYGGLHGESTGMTAHRFRFSGKEYDPMCGLNGYDFGARWQQPDLTRFGQMDPLAEKTPEISPYAYCAGDPVNRIDPDGRDWYIDRDETIQYSPDVHSQDDLQEGQKYLWKEKNKTKQGIHYRADGSIMYKNETEAYKRMWTQADKHYRQQDSNGREVGGFILKNGNVLILPDYDNNYNTSKIEDYGYKIRNDGSVEKDGTVFYVYAQIHTHQRGSGNEVAPSNADAIVSELLGSIPIFTMSFDGKVYGAVAGSTQRGDFPPFPMDSLLNGHIHLFNYLRTNQHLWKKRFK